MSSNNEIKDNRHGDNRFPAPEDQPFNTPDSYFDLLGPRIKDRISASSQAPIPVRHLFKSKVLIAAAAILIILVTVPVVWNAINKKASNGQASNGQASNGQASNGHSTTERDSNGESIRDKQYQEDVYFYLSVASYSEEELVDMLIEAAGNEQDIVLYNSAENLVHIEADDDKGLSEKELIMDYLLYDGIRESELTEL